MEKRFDIEVIVGIFVLIGIFSLGYLSVRLGQVEVFGAERYTVYAEFAQAGGVKTGGDVEIAGVTVGSIKSITLGEDYLAEVAMSIDRDVEVQRDAIASIKTRGLIGEKYIQISPGGSEESVPPGGRIRDTEPAVDLEGLISQFVFGKI